MSKPLNKMSWLEVASTYSPKFRLWLVDTAGVKQDATDAEFFKAAGDALASGRVTADDLFGEYYHDGVQSFLTRKFQERNLEIPALVKEWMVKTGRVTESASDTMLYRAAAIALASNEISPADLGLKGKQQQQITSIKGTKPTMSTNNNSNPNTNKATFSDFAAAVDATNGGSGNVTVKAPSERYDDTRIVCKHAKTGMPVHDERGREVCAPTLRTKAKAGALLKVMAKRAGIEVEITDHDRDLWGEMLEKDVWCGKMGGTFYDEIPGFKVKALLGDSTSGGLEVVPAWFDRDLITFPLLYGELYPVVTVVDVPASNRVEWASISTPTMSWGTAEGSQIAMFNTDSMVAELNTSIYDVGGAVEIGRHFLNDTPAAVGETVERLMGLRLAAELDKVIAEGNGTSQPEGIFTASGITAVTPTGGAGTAQTVTDYEAMYFTVPKQYRTAPGSRVCFLSTDTSYQRARGISVGATDQRRVWGMDNYDSYTMMGRPYKISNDLSSNQLACGDFSKYRLYRRQGMEVQYCTGDLELMRKRTVALIVNGRFGGRLMDANAFTKITNGQA